MCGAGGALVDQVRDRYLRWMGRAEVTEPLKFRGMKGTPAEKTSWDEELEAVRVAIRNYVCLVEARCEFEHIEPRQVSNGLVELFMQAAPIHNRLQRFLKELIAEDAGVEVVTGQTGQPLTMKDFWRAMEKITWEVDPAKRDQARCLFDVARSGLSCTDYNALGRCTDKIFNHPSTEVVRIKDRLTDDSKVTSCGWAKKGGCTCGGAPRIFH